MSMTHDEMIAVIQAHKDGKEIEFRDQRFTEFKEWVQCREPHWNFRDCTYRIKPEPLVLWAVHVESVLVGSNHDEDLMIRVFNEHNAQFKNVTMKKFVEVTES